MIHITKVLCPTDFSACAQAAVPIACSLARDFRATLILLHVRPMPATVAGEFGTFMPEPPESKDSLQRKNAQVLAGQLHGRSGVSVREGDASEAILKTAHTRHCDLIVLGTHGRSGLHRLLVGSVAEAVLRRAPCPVMTIKLAQAEPVPTPNEAGKSAPFLNADDLATVCAVANPVEAEIIRNALNGESIPCVVNGLQQAGLVGMLGIPISIQVRAGDFDRASKYIKNREAHRR